MKCTPGLLLVAGCLIAAFGGYRFGHDGTQRLSSFEEDAGSTRTGRPDDGATRTPEALAALKAGVTRSYESSPSAEHDWILRGQTAALLAGMTPAELASLFDTILVRREDGTLQGTSVGRRVLVTDLLFTLTGAILVVVTGSMMAHRYGGASSQGWIAWSYALFTLSGLIWAVVLVPIQLRQRTLLRRDRAITAEYLRLSRIWQFSGAIATVVPLPILYLMITKVM